MTKKVYLETLKSILGCSIFHYSENILSSLVVICMEGPECENCDLFQSNQEDQTKLENIFTKNAIKRKDQQC